MAWLWQRPGLSVVCNKHLQPPGIGHGGLGMGGACRRANQPDTATPSHFSVEKTNQAAQTWERARETEIQRARFCFKK